MKSFSKETIFTIKRTIAATTTATTHHTAFVVLSQLLLKDLIAFRTISFKYLSFIKIHPSPPETFTKDESEKNARLIVFGLHRLYISPRTQIHVLAATTPNSSKASNESSFISLVAVIRADCVPQNRSIETNKDFPSFHHKLI